jgi:hypothetical protein
MKTRRRRIKRRKSKKEVEIVEEPQPEKQKRKYIKKEPTLPPKMIADMRTAAKKAKKRASPKRFKS